MTAGLPLHVAGHLEAPLRLYSLTPVHYLPQGCAQSLVCLVVTRLGIDPNQARIVKPGATMPGEPENLSPSAGPANHGGETTRLGSGAGQAGIWGCAQPCSIAGQHKTNTRFNPRITTDMLT